jgi:hypothetical protein
MTTRSHFYRSFVLHIWREGGLMPDERPAWRMSLEDPHSAERVGFTNVDELITYLVRWTDNPPALENDKPDLLQEI